MEKTTMLKIVLGVVAVIVAFEIYVFFLPERGVEPYTMTVRFEAAEPQSITSVWYQPFLERPTEEQVAMTIAEIDVSMIEATGWMTGPVELRLSRGFTSSWWGLSRDWYQPTHLLVAAVRADGSVTPSVHELGDEDEEQTIRVE